jgi:hypothetical protein
VTNSQLFNFNGGAGPLALQPQNQAGSCLVVKGNALDIAACKAGDATQSFTLGGAAGGGGNANGGKTNAASSTNGANGATEANGASKTNGVNNGNASNANGATSTSCTKSTRTVTVAPSKNGGNGATQASTTAAAEATTSAAAAGTGTGAGAGGILSVNPTDPVPVSRAGGTLQPTAAAQSHQRDETAKRAFTSVSIRAPNGQCLFVDPTAGDFRQNLIPVSLVDCTGSPNEKWDLITEGKHNKPNPNRSATLVVSALVGCIPSRGG